jgi:hypothetical protein
VFCFAQESICELVSSKNIIPVIAIGGGLFVAIVAIVMGCIQGMVVGRAREQTKRELAAYVAEGTMDADKAIELANAGKRSCES